MANESKPKLKGNIVNDEENVRPADQAEGERDGKTTTKVKRTPGSAEGERGVTGEAIGNKGRQSKR
jgi:hypothetical protein